MKPSSCAHPQVVCLNEYELIRKYRCRECEEVVMCSCEERIGRRFLPHQLSMGQELQTKERVEVTLGFQPSICRECRGLPPLPFPKAAIYGHTSKIKRFYWRELQFRQFELMEQLGVTSESLFSADAPFDRTEIATTALADIKALHAAAPKYSLATESEADFLARVPAERVELRAPVLGHGKLLAPDDTVCSPEQFAASWLDERGFSSLECESVPFHTLFAVMLWMVIQDPTDPLVQVVGFGERASFESLGRSDQQIWTHLPDDFGSSGYSQRRAAAVESFFGEHLQGDTDDLLFVFDLGVEPSFGLRQYLWAHKEGDLERARHILSVLPPEKTRKILRYLLDSYWQRYLGWPDLFAWRGTDFVFVEVKLSKDKLSDEQRSWVEANNELLELPFKLLRIARA